MKSINQKQTISVGDNLYNKFGKPMEKDHWGEYIAISNDGKFVLGSNLLRVMKKSLADLGPGSHLFKVGEKSVFKWLRIKL